MSGPFPTSLEGQPKGSRYQMRGKYLKNLRQACPQQRTSQHLEGAQSHLRALGTQGVFRGLQARGVSSCLPQGPACCAQGSSRVNVMLSCSIPSDKGQLQSTAALPGRQLCSGARFWLSSLGIIRSKDF